MKKLIIGLVIVTLCALWVLNCTLTEKLVVDAIENSDPHAVVEVLDNGLFSGKFEILVYNNDVVLRQSMNLITKEHKIVGYAPCTIEGIAFLR